MRSPDSPIDPLVRPFIDTAAHVPKKTLEAGKEAAKNIALFPVNVGKKILWETMKTGWGVIKLLPFLASGKGIGDVTRNMRDWERRAEYGQLFSPRTEDIATSTRDSVQSVLEGGPQYGLAP